MIIKINIIKIILILIKIKNNIVHYLLLFTIYYLLFIIFIIYYLFFIIYYLLFIIYYLLFIIYYLLFIIYYLLFIIYYLWGLHFANFSRDIYKYVALEILCYIILFYCIVLLFQFLD